MKVKVLELNLLDILRGIVAQPAGPLPEVRKFTKVDLRACIAKSKQMQDDLLTIRTCVRELLSDTENKDVITQLGQALALINTAGYAVSEADELMDHAVNCPCTGWAEEPEKTAEAAAETPPEPVPEAAPEAPSEPIAAQA